MKYFFDTEYAFNTESWNRGPHLISIGIVAEDGREYYAVNHKGPYYANEFVRSQVLPHLGEPWKTEDEIKKEVQDFIGDDVPEFWCYFGAFDYVLLSQLMGGFEQWPQKWPYLAYDLRQWLDAKDLQGVSQEGDMTHHALDDARWIAATYKKYNQSPQYNPPFILEVDRKWIGDVSKYSHESMEL